MDFFNLVKELLIEATADEIYDRYYKNIDRKIFDRIVSYDPQTVIKNDKIVKIGRYSKLILSMFMNNELKLEDLPKSKEYLTYIYKHQIPVNYSTIKTLSDLYGLVSKYIVKTKTNLGSIISSLDEKEYDLLLDGEKWLIYTPKTEKAACYLGVSTEWCTTWGKHSLNKDHKGRDNRFRSYNVNGPLYILINKNDETDKYQFHFETKQYMDKNDRRIDITSFLDKEEEIKRFFFPSIDSDVKDEVTINRQINRMSVLSKEDMFDLFNKIFKHSKNPFVNAILKGEDLDKYHDENVDIWATNKEVSITVDNDEPEIERITYSYSFFTSYYNNYDSFSSNIYDDEFITSELNKIFKDYYENQKKSIYKWFHISKYEIFEKEFYADFINDDKIKEEYQTQLGTAYENAYDQARDVIGDKIKKYLYVNRSNSSEVVVDIPLVYFCYYLQKLNITHIDSANDLLIHYCDYWDVPTYDEWDHDYYEYVEYPSYKNLEYEIDSFFERMLENYAERFDCVEIRDRFAEIKSKFFNDEDVFENEIVKIELLDYTFNCETKTIKIKYTNKENNKTYEGNVTLERLMQYATNRSLMEEKRMKIKLTENQIKRVLTEASKKDVLINKLGFSEENAQILFDLCGPLSVFMANKIIEQLRPLGQNGIEKFTKENLIGQTRRHIISIMDWIRIGLNGNISQYKDKDFPTLNRLSHEWHESLKTGDGDVNYKENNQVIRDYRKDGIGFYWVNLKTNDSSEECDRMGHCGRTSNGNTLYSLRQTKKINDKNTINSSHLTAAVGVKDGIIYQMKGKKNSKPKNEYHKYIVDLLGNIKTIKGFGYEYDSKNDFSLSDLDKETALKLYNIRQDLFNNRKGRRVLKNLGLSDIEVNNSFTLKLEPDDVHRWLRRDFVVSQRKKENGVEINTYFSEALLGGNIWDIYESGYDNEAWKYDLDSIDEKNKKRILEILKNKAEESGEEIDLNEDLETLISNYDEDRDIIRCLNGARESSEADSYYEYGMKQLRKALSEYGEVKKMNDEGVEIFVDLDKILDGMDESDIDEYFENCNDEPSCVLYEVLGYFFEPPALVMDDRWYPDYSEKTYNEHLEWQLDNI